MSEGDTMTTETETRARNLEAVCRAFDAIGAGDVDRQLENYTEDCVLELPYSDPPKRLEGRETVRAYLGGALGAFELALGISEVHPCDDPDELVVEFTGTGTYRPNGAAYANTYIAVYRFRDGLIRFQREFYNPAAAARSASGG